MKYAIELSRKQSAAILEDACNSQLAVWFQAKAWKESQSMRMQLTAFSDGGLELAGDYSGELDMAALANTYCHLHFVLAQSSYFFESHILLARSGEHQLKLSVARPERILVLQRRRSERKAMARSSSVQISRQVADELSSYEGNLYNLSTNGLAFKISKIDCEYVEIGQHWCVCFEVPEQDHVYKLDAVVRRKMKSSSEDDIILGLEFDTADGAQLKLLREFLEIRQRVSVQSN